MSTSGDWTLLHAFSGEIPQGGLVEGDNGFFYGTTENGGNFGLGTFYRVDAAGGFAVLRDFSSSEVVNPGGLWYASDGNFYGASRLGGTAEGNVYRLTAAGDFGVLHVFDGATGSGPVGGLIEASDGYFYGTTHEGGASGEGVVYRIDFSGELEVLSSFAAEGGSYPQCTVIESPPGTFYGTAANGGAQSGGTAFSFNSAGDVTLLHDFTATDGFFPLQGLIEAPDGFLYGITTSLGAEGFGAFFRMDTAGSVTVLHDFSDAEGQAPSYIVRPPERAFYGINQTSVIKLDTAGALTTLYTFPDVLVPHGFDRIIEGSDGDLYGTTHHGGAFGFGTVFRLTKDGVTFTTLHEFSGIEGSFPVGRLLEASDGKFYGSTIAGGLSNTGVQFRMDGSGLYELLHSNGVSVSGDGVSGTTLIEAADGYLYGSNVFGGSLGLGTVFRMDKNGNETVLHSFGRGGSDGGAPNGALLSGSDGLLYGVHGRRRRARRGTLFRVDPAATLPVLAVSPASGPAGGGTSILDHGRGFPARGLGSHRDLPGGDGLDAQRLGAPGDGASPLRRDALSRLRYQPGRHGGVARARLAGRLRRRAADGSCPRLRREDIPGRHHRGLRRELVLPIRRRNARADGGFHAACSPRQPLLPAARFRHDVRGRGGR